MGWVLIFVMLLFILPTYNLVKSYRTLQERRQEVVKLTKDYQTLTNRTENQKLLAKQLKIQITFKNMLERSIISLRLAK